MVPCPLKRERSAFCEVELPKVLWGAAPEGEGYARPFEPRPPFWSSPLRGRMRTPSRSLWSSTMLRPWYGAAVPHARPWFYYHVPMSVETAPGALPHYVLCSMMGEVKKDWLVWFGWGGGGDMDGGSHHTKLSPSLPFLPTHPLLPFLHPLSPTPHPIQTTTRPASHPARLWSVPLPPNMRRRGAVSRLASSFGESTRHQVSQDHVQAFLARYKLVVCMFFLCACSGFLGGGGSSKRTAGRGMPYGATPSMHQYNAFPASSRVAAASSSSSSSSSWWGAANLHTDTKTQKATPKHHN